MAINRESHVLVVAGTDSSGGAGVTRDVETIAALGLSSCVAVTAVTAQTHRSVDWIEPMPPRFIAAQMRAAIAANSVKAIKIGMLGTDGAIQAAAKVLRDHSEIPAVLDPVLAASSGRALIVEDAVAALRRDLMPLCRLVTPNMPELAVLTGSASPPDEASACCKGEELVSTIWTAVLVKGGHASASESVDLLLQPHRPALRYASPRLPRQMRGTGCMLSSAIAASLALGASLETSVRRARQYVFDALAGSK